MLKNTFVKYIVLALSVLVVVSCSEYEKVLKSNDYNYKYRKAIQYFNKKDYARSISIFEQIINFYRASTKGDSVMYFFAKSYYGEEDYLMAGNYFKELSENYVRSPFVEEADYMVGYCFYLTSPRATLDQESTRSGMVAFQKFIYKHPSSKYVPECKRLVEELNNKLAEKAFLNASVYYNIGSYDARYYKAAIIALRNCLSDFPETTHREDLMFMLLQSSYLLAENSVIEKRKERYQNTLDEYYSFIGEFPQSKFNSQVEKMYKHTKDALGM
jgi:outer membrane protein assembly factor BamD